MEESTSNSEREVEEDQKTTLFIVGGVQPDPRGLQVALVERTFTGPTSFDGIHPGDYRAISTMPGFVRVTAMYEGEEAYDRFSDYCWGDLFFWYVDTAAVWSPLCHDAIAVEDIDLSHTGDVDGVVHIACEQLRKRDAIVVRWHGDRTRIQRRHVEIPLQFRQILCREPVQH